MNLNGRIKAENVARLRKLCPRKARVYGITRHISKSGMLHIIDLYVIKGNQPIRITGMISTTFTTFTYNRTHKGLAMRGCGYNHVQAAVNNLAYALYQESDALKYDSI